MRKKLLVIIGFLALLGCTRSPQDVLENAATTMGATTLKSIQYSGNGYAVVLGQNLNPNDPGPRFNLTSYARLINYETVASREELVRDGGFQPQQVQMVSGNHAWTVVGSDPTPVPAPVTVNERQLQISLTPHGWIKAALSSNPTMESRTVDGRQITGISFTAQGKYQVKGTINEQNLVERVETWIPNPVLGDMLVETDYSEYKDFDGVKFPTKILQKQGGFPTLELTVSNVQPNVAADMEAPESVRQATAPPVRVESQKVADGVWFLAGGSHNSVAVEFQDSVAVIEAPLNEQRSEAVIAEVKKLLPNKPIRYLVNSHHHFDHSGGIRTYVAEGATIVTHEVNKPFYERVFQAPHTLSPDRLSRANTPAKFETVAEKHVLTDGARTMEIYPISGNTHNEGSLMVYLPKEKILVEADAYSPRPGQPPPAASPFTVSLFDNIQRLKLDVNRIAPVHGQVVPLAELLKVLGKRG